MYYAVVAIILFKTYILKKFKKSLREKLSAFLGAASLVFVCAIICAQIYQLYFENYVIFFNVGQGSMALIRQDRKVIVIDMGSTSKSASSNALDNYLKAKAIKKVDLLLITHFHSDHVNGLYSLSDNIEISNIAYLEPEASFNVVEEYYKVMEIIDEKEISKLQLKNLDSMGYNNVRITLLAPEDDIVQASDIANANSVIYIACVSGKNYLFMGDATKESETYYIDKIKNSNDDSYKEVEKLLGNIYVASIGHHGSNTSTSEEFLENINLEYAVISARKSVYGHPSDEVLKRLEKFNIKYYLTEEKGAIKF